jgi:hypothetical protein
MEDSMKIFFKPIIVMISFLIGGCAIVPSLRVSQPWIRSLKANQIIDPTKTIKIEVTGTTSPLLGSEQLTSERLRSSLIQLIKRRGFTVDNSTYDYLVRLFYKTDRNDKTRFSSTVSSTNSQAYGISTSTGAGATSGLGVSIARAIGVLISRSSAVAAQTAEQMLSYTHTISIELSNREGAILWKGESTWDSEELNLINGIIPALQLILSDLPSDKAVRPDIPEVKETHVKNYYRLECKDVWFTCPALPYRIYFEDNSLPASNDISISNDIQNQNAFATYVDLLQTAEYALPDGDEKSWKDPLKISLWKKVTLGGQYFLGPHKIPINILIVLTGKSDGYYIDGCKIATEKEFSNFNDKLTRWREILSSYYDVYEK